MMRAAMTGLLLLFPLGLAVGCGGGNDDADVPAGYVSVELDGMRFVLPKGLPIDEEPDDGALFIARKAGTLAAEPRVVGQVRQSGATLLQAVAQVRNVNVSGVRDFKPRSDVEFDVPGSDEARRVTITFLSGDDNDIPTTRTTVVAKKGDQFYLFSVAVPDARRGEMDADTIAESLELT